MVDRLCIATKVEEGALLDKLAADHSYLGEEALVVVCEGLIADL